MYAIVILNRRIQMDKLLERYKKALAEVSDVLVDLEEELESLSMKPLRVKIRERFKVYIEKQGPDKATKLLQKYRCRGLTEIKDEDLEKFVDDIGGI